MAVLASVVTQVDVPSAALAASLPSPTFPDPMATVASASGKVPAAASMSAARYSAGATPTSTTTPTPSGPVWEELSPASTPRVVCENGAYDEATGQTVLYGGEVATSSGEATGNADTWTFDGTTWTKQSPATSPPGFYYSAMTYDQARQQVVMFGGHLNSPNSGTNSSWCDMPLTDPSETGDTWLWSGSNWTKATPAVSPPPRVGAGLVYDPAIGKSILFGGEVHYPQMCVCSSSLYELNDTWVWDGSTWTQLSPSTSPPGQPGPIEMAYDPVSKSVVFIGAGSTSGPNSTWLFDGTNWTEHQADGAVNGAMALDPGLGGIVVVNDNTPASTWLWDGQSKQWTPLQASVGNAAPGPQNQFTGVPVFVHDTVRNTDFLYSSQPSNTSPGGVDAQTWAYDRPQAPLLSKTVDRGASGLYSSGEVATYTLTLGSTNVYNTQSPVAVTDTLPASLAPIPASVQLAGQPCNATTTPACVFTGNTLTVRGIGVSPLRTTTLVYSAVTAGVDRACSVVTNAATATNGIGTGTASVPITVCDTGLGLEKYWQFVTRTVGPQATASVNVANGNLVLQQQDSTTIDAHGKLAYVLRRTYNSQDNLLVSVPGSIGAGWVLNLADAGDSLSDASAAGLYVPPAESVLDAAGVTLVDRDGTRHVFTPRAVAVAGTVATTALPAVGPTFTPRALQLDPGYASVSIDTLYTAPAGVHLSLWRYIETSSGCSPTACVSNILGYGAERPDRVRLEFTADGRQVSMADGNGNELRYVYEATPPAGVLFPRLLQVYEPRSCSQPLASTCRSFAFSYPTSQSISVTDPAGRVTTYHLDTATPPHLTSVDNPDGSHLSYTYGGCGGTANQLCSATDPRGGVTKFTYSPVTLSLPRIAQVVDRDGNTTAFNYSSGDLTATLDADTGTERRRFSGIDDNGRVGQVDHGSTSDAYLHHATYAWDTAASPCVKPSGMVDNQLCQETTSSLTSITPDQTTTYTYNDEGQTLSQSTATGLTAEGSITTSWGYHAQYFQADGAVQTYDDTVAGAGQVTSAGPPTGRATPATLFAISDLTQKLTARGNAAGSSFSPYLTSYLVDDNDSVGPNAVPPAGGTCSNPASPTANTGNVCQVDAPMNGSSPDITRYTYDQYGQRATMTTPKAVAEGGTTPPSYTYTYYQDGDLDLSGSVSAGGWLKAVTDPYGRFVLFAYDRAGNLVRSYERNATSGHLVTDALSSFGSTYSQTLYGSGSTALSAPWRYPPSQTDALGNTTAYTLDANGNQTAIRPPRGSAANVATYDLTQSFDANDNLLSHQSPVESGKPTTYMYDQYGNRASMTDPNGNVTAYQYDSVNRLAATVWTRGAWSSSTPVPSACHDSGASDSPIPSGLTTCSMTSSYDGEDNVIATQDGNHQTTTLTYDAAHRKQTRLAPRNDGAYTTLETAWVYDADGNTTDTCPPNQFTLPAAVCNASSIYGTHYAYDPAGHRLTVTTYRAAGGAAQTTTTSYDADGNPTTVVDPNGHTTGQTYDYTDRRTSAAVQRDPATSETTSWQYDPSGDVTAEIQPAGEVTAYSYDADNRVLDTVVGSTSTTASQAGTVSADGGSNVRTRLAYDQDGHIAAVYAPGAFVTAGSVTSPDASFMTRRDYDADGRPITQYIPRYDGSGHSDLGLSSTQTGQCPTGVTPQQSVPNVPAWPSGVGVCTTKVQYDADGNAVQLTLPTSTGSDNRYVTYTYTNDNLLTAVCTPNPSGAATTCPGSSASGRVLAQTTYYDADAKPVETVDALGNASLTSYFSDELVHQATAPSNGAITHVTTYGYDANGNRTQTTDPMGLSSSTAYFSDNLISSLTDPAGDVTSYTYDPAGNRVSVASPTANAHDANNTSGTPTTFTYTFDNLLATTTQPVSPTGSLRRETLYGYDASGRKASVQTLSTNATGQQVGDGGTQSFTYFGDERLNAQSSSLGGAITTTYAPSGQPAQITDTSEGGSTLTATYYLDGTPRTVDDGTRTTQSTYDGLESPAASAVAVDGSSTKYLTTYSYGDAERPSSMADTSVTGSGSTTWTYDAAGRPQKETAPNGATVTSSFNPDNTLSSQMLANSSGTGLASWSYLYDADYRITQQQFSGSGASGATPQLTTFCYHYDAASRLDGFQTFAPGTSCGAVAPAITHDHDGNRLLYTDPTSGQTTTFTYNADDSIATAQPSGVLTPFLFTYTPAGDLVSDGCATNSYDGFDRLTQYTTSGVAGCPSATSRSFAYDGLDRQRLAGGTSIHYLGLSSAVSAETVGGTDTIYAMSPAAKPLAVAVENGSPTPQYLVDDGHGNITTAVTSSQAVACTARFDPYGVPVAPASPLNPCNTGTTVGDIFYGGGRRDATSGRYELGSRTYDPSKASFLTPDTYRTAPSSANLAVGTDPLTENRYTYVNGDPVNLVDPSGHDAWWADAGPGGGGRTESSGPEEHYWSGFGLYGQRVTNDHYGALLADWYKHLVTPYTVQQTLQTFCDGRGHCMGDPDTCDASIFCSILSFWKGVFIDAPAHALVGGAKVGLCAAQPLCVIQAAPKVANAVMHPVDTAKALYRQGLAATREAMINGTGSELGGEALGNALMIGAGGAEVAGPRLLGGALDFSATDAAVDAGVPAEEGTIFRVHGGQSDVAGHSWTPTDPTTLANPRASLGLPNVNSGEFLSKARIKDWTGISARRALPLDGNPGGEIEYLVPDPLQQLDIFETLPVRPPW